MRNIKESKILIISLIANALLLGLILGKGFGCDMDCRGNCMRDKMPFCQKDDCKSHDFMKRHKKDPEMREAHENVKKAMLAEPYDKQAVLKAFEELDNKMQVVKKEFYTKIADEAEKLEPEERLKLLPSKKHDKKFNRRCGNC